MPAEHSNNLASGDSTSRSLIVRLQLHEPPAWRDVVSLYSPLIAHWCRREGLPQQECADVVQDVFRSVYTGIANFRRQTENDSFRAWLRIITRNKVIDHFRRAVRQPVAQGGSAAVTRFRTIAEDDDESIGEATDLQAEHALFARALAMIQREFRPKTWDAFRLVVMEGKSASEAADQLEMKPGAVRVAKSRVLKRLREQLGDLPE